VFERLADERVVARRPRPDDAVAIAAAFAADAGMGEAIGAEEDPTEETLRARFAEPADPAATFHEFVIAEADGERCVGQLIVHSVDRQNRRCEVGFMLAPQARGRGLATAAIELAVDWLFTDGGFDRIEMTTLPSNREVFRLAERLGFEHEGTLRQRNLERGRRVDVAWFGRLRL
jgi:RimJ/RimL family protein N-acetyltransferase